MTTARVKHRDYIPPGWLAIEFCDVDFVGDEAEFFDSMWKKIEYKKFDRDMPNLEHVESCINKYMAEIDTIGYELKQIKKWWKFWKSAEEKYLEQKQSLLIQNIEKAKAERDILENNMLYEPAELVFRVEKFLKENGFILKSTSSSNDGCVTYTDLWTKE